MFHSKSRHKSLTWCIAGFTLSLSKDLPLPPFNIPPFNVYSIGIYYTLSQIDHSSVLSLEYRRNSLVAPTILEAGVRDTAERLRILLKPSTRAQLDASLLCLSFWLCWTSFWMLLLLTNTTLGVPEQGTAWQVLLTRSSLSGFCESP